METLSANPSPSMDPGDSFKDVLCIVDAPTSQQHTCTSTSIASQSDLIPRTGSTGSVYSLASFLKPGVLDDEGPSGETGSVDLSSVDHDEEKPQVVAGWALSLKNLLADPNGSAMFQKYCQQLLCEENLLFWNAVEGFRAVEDDQVEQAAREIFNEFVHSSGAHQVNLNSKTAKAVKAIFKEHKPITREIYDPCQDEIFVLMKTDSYGKFLQSQAYKDVVCMELAGERLPWEEENTPSSQKKKGILSFLRTKKKSITGEDCGKMANGSAGDKGEKQDKKFHIHVRRKSNNTQTS